MPGEGSSVSVFDAAQLIVQDNTASGIAHGVGLRCPNIIISGGMAHPCMLRNTAAEMLVALVCIPAPLLELYLHL